jgi:drug/metabolite transporter (DMT)-like permease
MTQTAAAAPARQASRDTLIAAGITITLWASAFAGIRAGLESYGPESLALLRYLIASGALAIYASLARMPLPDKGDWPGLALFGFLGFSLYNVALNAGEVTVSAGMASFLIATEPVHLALLGTLVLGERFTRWGWIGIAISFVGVAIISLGADDGWRIDWRALLILGAAVIKALYSVGQKGYLRKYGALRFTTYAIWTGTLFLLIFLPGLLADLRTASAESTTAIVYLGIFPGVIAYAAWSSVLARIPASIAGSLLYLVPGLATIIAWVWLGETPGASAILGGALVIAGVIVVNRMRAPYFYGKLPPDQGRLSGKNP